MKPKILSWNVRGLNNPNKCLRVKNLIRDWKADILCLQETKLKYVDRNIIRSLWNCTYAGWTSLPSKGASGGIIVMWDKRVVDLVEESVDEFVVACSFKSLEDGFMWGFAGVYGPNNDNSRKLLWDEIAGLCSWWEGPWCIGGDFNTTRFSSERSGDSNSGSAMADFSALIFELDLIDLPLGGVTTLGRMGGHGLVWTYLLSLLPGRHISPLFVRSASLGFAQIIFHLCWTVVVFKRGGDTSNSKICG
ncbi:hypothetical protein CIPAW_02G060000 [Carya illinoinensis]|uniref:Endonuclease/exonuclease/phosphatase domain-containing protein n=1 Tax=Carya illinoinensis TaxID=32201 RepID=A0A8T1RBK5_CARIL|nr:hypothetical protein CIPAW_02G060000 [Carya illinoinensis]